MELLLKETVKGSQPEILDAIKSHTTGRVGMGLLEQIIFVADYIEPGRTFPTCVKCREIAENSLVDAVLFEYKSVFKFLHSEGKNIYPLALNAYESFKKEHFGGIN